MLLTLGARRQTVDVDSFAATGAVSSGYRATATSPLVGVVVKPWEHVSVYANMTDGLTRGTIVGATYANRGDILAPYKSRQYETGVKVDWGRVITSAALFQIARPAGQADENNVYGYFGEQRNRGLELAAYGEVRPSRACSSAVSGRADGNALSESSVSTCQSWLSPRPRSSVSIAPAPLSFAQSSLVAVLSS